MTLPKMKVGMIGVGGFGAYRRQRLRDAGCFELAVCCDRNEETLKQACAEEGAEGVRDFAEMIARPDLEGIIISTGIDTHARFAIAAMQAGKHVFVEKPLCGTAQEARDLIAVRNDTGKVFGLGHQDAHTDAFAILVRSTIDSGRLGTIACYEENSSHSGGLEIQPGDWRGLPERNPGGMLLQCGVHSLHRLNYLFGPIQSVAAMMRYDVHPGTQTADVANVLIRHRSGMVGTLNCYHVTGYFHELRIFGTKGNLYIDTRDSHAWFQPRHRGPREDREPVEVPQPDMQHRCSNLLNWRQAVLHGTPARPSLEDGVAAVAPVFAAEIAARAGRETPIQ